MFNCQTMMVVVSHIEGCLSNIKANIVLAGCAAIYIDPAVRGTFDFAALLQ